jgi:hypothetical protein
MCDYGAAIRLIREMVKGGAGVDFVTLVIRSNACSRAGWLRLGKEIHGLAVRMHCDGIECKQCGDNNVCQMQGFGACSHSVQDAEKFRSGHMEYNVSQFCIVR